MSFSKDPVVNDIVLTVVNDGDGSQCGLTYKERCELAANGLYSYVMAAAEYGRGTRGNQRVGFGSPPATQKQIRAAADLIQAYYRERVREMQES